MLFKKMPSKSSGFWCLGHNSDKDTVWSCMKNDSISSHKTQQRPLMTHRCSLSSSRRLRKHKVKANYCNQDLPPCQIFLKTLLFSRREVYTQQAMFLIRRLEKCLHHAQILRMSCLKMIVWRNGNLLPGMTTKSVGVLTRICQPLEISIFACKYSLFDFFECT